jgi:hypothetical protein
MALWSHLALNVTAGAYFIYTLFHKVSDDDLSNCIASYPGDLISQYVCAKEFEIYRHVIITIYVVLCLFELCESSSLSVTPPPPQSFTMACDRICLLINEQVSVSSSPAILCSFGKRRRWVIRHPLRWLQPYQYYRRWRRHITTLVGKSMRSLRQIVHLVRITRRESELGDDEMTTMSSTGNTVHAIM